MSGEYLETTVSGTSYVRARKVIIEHPLDMDSTITFVRERVMTIGAEQLKTNVANVTATYNPAAVITLLNPETGEPTGSTTTHADVFQALFSYFYQLSQEADA